MPPHVVRNWDALADALGELRAPGTPGQVLLLEHSEDVRDGARDEFKTAMEVLQSASAEWGERGVPLWTFVVLPEAEFDAL